MFKDKKIGFIGAGVMAKAIIKGLLSAGVVSAKNLCASEIDEELAKKNSEELKIIVTTDNRELVKNSDIIVLAVKPASLEQVLYEIKDVVTPSKLIVSIAAGISTDFIAIALEHKSHVVRAMPNIPAVVHEGMTAVCKGRHASDEQADMIVELFSSIGRAVRVPERLINSVTALCGSGPAFIYTIIEAMADGGLRLGLTKQAAIELAAQTVLGAAKMVLESGKHPSMLKDEVATPGGCTIVGILTMEEEKVRHSMSKTILDTCKAASELSK